MGELILYVMEKGVIEIIIGIGGSVLNDGGIGMVSVFGYEFLDVENNIVNLIGVNLVDIVIICFEKVLVELENIIVNIVMDVENLFCGEVGVLYVFGL